MKTLFCRPYFTDPILTQTFSQPFGSGAFGSPGQYFPQKITKIVESKGTLPFNNVFWGTFLTVCSTIKMKLKLSFFVLPHFFSRRANTGMVCDIDQLGLELKIHESYDALQKYKLRE